jgi:hypothetical protein
MRLDFYAKLFLRKWTYQRLYTHYGGCFVRFYGALLFVLGIISVFLNSIQVVATVAQIHDVARGDELGMRKAVVPTSRTTQA